MTKSYIRSLVLLAGLALILSQGGFAQASPSAAVSAARADVAQHPNSTAAYINLATAENDASHPDEAIAAASHALAMPSTETPGTEDFRPFAYYDLAIAYLQKGDIASAVSQMDTGLSRYPGSPSLSDTKGRLLMADGQFSRASEVLVPAFVSATHTSDKVTVAAWGMVWDDYDLILGYDLILSQYYAGQYPQALESARKLVALRELGSVCANPDLDPKTKDMCTYMARPEEGNIRHGHSLSSIDGRDVSGLPEGIYVKHLLKGPVGSVAEISYSWVWKGKTITKNVQIVRQAVPLTKDAADDFALLALTLNANGDREHALTMAQKAISLDPGNFWAELSCGLVLEDSNRPDEALKALETPTTPSSILRMALRQSLRQIHLAVLYARKGDMAKAQEIYLASQIDPRCVPAVKEKNVFLALVQPIINTHLATAKQLEAQGKYAESLPEYAQVLGFAASEQEASTLRAAMFAASSNMPTPPEMPNDAHRHVVRGELLLKQGMLDRASAEFNEALRIAPYMPKLYQNTAVIYGELKQYDRAIRQMNLYLKVAPEAPDARTAQDQITKWELLQEMGGKQ